MPWVTLFQQGVEGGGGGMAATRGIGHGGRVSISEDGVFPTMLLELLYHGGHPHLKNLSKTLNSVVAVDRSAVLCAFGRVRSRQHVLEDVPAI